MLVDERKAELLRVLEKTGRVVATDASRAMGVSEDTIRRDLRDMARDGLLKRVHGGAMPLSPAIRPFADRVPIGDDEKAAIGRRAATMIEPGQLVFLDGGTTALQVARHLAPGLSATIITHSPNVALELMAHPDITIELAGGRLFRHSIVTAGAATLAWLGRYRPDLAFIGATGLHPDHGLTTGDSEEAEVKRFVIARAGAAFCLASSEKIGAVSSFEICGFGDLDGVITTGAADSGVLDRIAALGCDVVQAGAAA